MLFSSTIFIFLFLPAVLIVHLLIRNEYRNAFLLMASLFFYAWSEVYLVLIMLFSITINYLIGLWLDYLKDKKSAAKFAVILAVIFNIGLLGVFKYANFIVLNFNKILTGFDVPIIELSPIHLPIGISFFTFQAMSYVIDIYRNQSKVQRNPINFGLYISMFPQLIAGPIVRYHDISKQIVERCVRLNDLSYGIKRFIIGLGKKVLIANTLAKVADMIFALSPEHLTFSLAWTGIICYSLQIYFDFSGYSDMAIGLARMLGFNLLENFNYPYIAKSIREFWQRWHISLSNWFRDYLYIPLGGSRRKPVRVYFNLWIVFILCGLWHGASWNFLIWGIYHGGFLVLERLRFGRWLDKLWTPLRHAYTILVVMVGWVIFRAENIPNTIIYLKAMFGLSSSLNIYPLAFYLDQLVILTLIAGIVGSTPILLNISKYLTEAVKSNKSFDIAQMTYSLFTVILLLITFISSTMLLASGTYNPFIYFRF